MNIQSVLKKIIDVPHNIGFCALVPCVYKIFIITISGEVSIEKDTIDVFTDGFKFKEGLGVGLHT